MEDGHDAIKKLNKDLILREKLAIQRTILANQSTLLAFIKTAMYFAIVGITIRALLKFEGLIFVEISIYLVALTLFFTAGMLFSINIVKLKIVQYILGTINWIASLKKIEPEH